MTQLEIDMGKKEVRLYFGYMLARIHGGWTLFLLSSACCCHKWAACCVFGRSGGRFLSVLHFVLFEIVCTGGCYLYMLVHSEGTRWFSQ